MTSGEDMSQGVPPARTSTKPRKAAGFPYPFAGRHAVLSLLIGIGIKVFQCHITLWLVMIGYGVNLIFLIDKSCD